MKSFPFIWINFFIIKCSSIKLLCLNAEKQKRNIRKKEKNYTHQHSLQLTNCLVLYRLAVDFSDFVTNVQGCLSMNHAAMHNSCHNAPSIFCHLQCDALNYTIYILLKIANKGNENWFNCALMPFVIVCLPLAHRYFFGIELIERV